MMITRLFVPTVLMVMMMAITADSATPTDDQLSQFMQSGGDHSNNWAVLVCASRYWFNYRHVANVLSIYRSVKRLGIPDSRIILMVADDMACDARNPKAATIYNNGQHYINVYGDDVEVDYRGYEVTVHNVIRLLTGRVRDGTPKTKQLLTDSGSNVLIYMTGHGGDGFLKFQDSEEITSVELADAFEQMWQKRRYNEILLIVDTCQAESLSQKIYSPNIVAIGSSKVGEDSLSHHGDPTIGVYVIDRYTYYALEFLEKVQIGSDQTLAQFMAVCPKRVCISTVSVNTENYRRRDPSQVPLNDFFGNVAAIDLIVLDNQTNVDSIAINNNNNNDDNNNNNNNDNNISEYKLEAKQVDHRYHYVDAFPFSLL
ncbi:putative GPI-anchor transamidase [Oppia nitens]|uniref:putative GPI-anchor transamidase n=1 Tax=Oppia nitens TaxID=1686743 RepID=UPI0023DA03C0|nr:putative GPI-anchor transamidase [Oppia nitens]